MVRQRGTTGASTVATPRREVGAVKPDEREEETGQTTSNGQPRLAYGCWSSACWRVDTLKCAFSSANGGQLTSRSRDPMQADLVVMGRRDAGNFRRAVLGSVVERVLHGARYPVLVVPESAGRVSGA